MTFYRFFFQLVCTLPLLLTVAGAGAFRAKRPVMNLIRGAIHAGATLMFFTAVKYMPLADVFAIYFVRAVDADGDVGGLSRREGRLAALDGNHRRFAGALIVIRPSWEVFGVTALLPVACAFLFALICS